jgi:hypothetical protein
MASLLGNGTTFAITTPSVAIGAVVNITPGNRAVASIDDDSLAVTGDHELIPGLLKSNGPDTLTCIFDPDDVPEPGTVATGTLTYPPKTGQTNGATKAGTGFIMDVQEQAIENDTRVLVQFQWQFDGKTGPSRADGS